MATILHPKYYLHKKVRYVERVADLREKVDRNLSPTAQFTLYSYLKRVCEQYQGEANKYIPGNYALKHVAIFFMYALLSGETGKEMHKKFAIAPTNWTRLFSWVLTRVGFARLQSVFPLPTHISAVGWL